MCCACQLTLYMRFYRSQAAVSGEGGLTCLFHIEGIAGFFVAEQTLAPEKLNEVCRAWVKVS